MTPTAPPCWAAAHERRRRSGRWTPQPAVPCPAGMVGGRSNAPSTPSPRCSRRGPTRPVISELAITSDPGSDGMYRTGDEIEVTATFGAPVAVGGRPRVKLRLGQGGESDRWAEYERGGAFAIADYSDTGPGQK